jgi:hypothetical protein
MWGLQILHHIQDLSHAAQHPRQKIISVLIFTAIFNFDFLFQKCKELLPSPMQTQASEHPVHSLSVPAVMSAGLYRMNKARRRRRVSNR